LVSVKVRFVELVIFTSGFAESANKLLGVEAVISIEVSSPHEVREAASPGDIKVFGLRDLLKRHTHSARLLKEKC